MWRPDGPMHDTAWWSSWQGALIIGLLLLIAGLLIWLVARSRVTPSGGGPRDTSGDDQAVAAARMRYARGELPREDFARIVQDLTGRPLPEAPQPQATPQPVSPPPQATARPASTPDPATPSTGPTESPSPGAA